MKIVTARINLKIVAICFLIFLFIILLTPKLIKRNNEQSIKEPITEKIEDTTEETSTKIMKDKNGNEYYPTSNLTVYLTFDDGPSKYTPQILDILDSYGIGATFFVINGKYNSYMKEIVNRGSVIALHSYSHKYPVIYSSTESFLEDLEKIHNLVLEETGVDTWIFRFPGGSSNTISRKYCKNIMSELVEEAEEREYVYIDWNCENGDAYGKETSADYQVKKATKYPKNAENVVILMHDIDKLGVNLTALKEIIEFYQEEGARFGVITEDSPQIHHNVNN